MNYPDDEEIEDEELEEEEEEEEEEEDEEDEEEDEDEDEEEDEDEDEDEEDEDEEDEDEDEEEEERVLDQSEAHAVTEAEELTAASPNDIPLNIVVEVGRVKMPVKSLMELKPGNLLELNVHPESGVDLVVNGSRVGKGELLQIGETLGIRILELG